MILIDWCLAQSLDRFIQQLIKTNPETPAKHYEELREYCRIREEGTLGARKIKYTIGKPKESTN